MSDRTTFKRKPTWNFDGKTYEWAGTFDLKSEAKNRADKIRSKGYFARVLKIKYKIQKGNERARSYIKYVVYERREK